MFCILDILKVYFTSVTSRYFENVFGLQAFDEAIFIWCFVRLMLFYI